MTAEVKCRFCKVAVTRTTSHCGDHSKTCDTCAACYRKHTVRPPLDAEAETTMGAAEKALRESIPGAW